MIKDKDLLDPGVTRVALVDDDGSSRATATFLAWAKDSHTEDLKAVLSDEVDDWWIADANAFLADWEIVS